MRSHQELHEYIDALKVDFAMKQMHQEKALNNSLNYVEYCKEFDRIEAQKSKIILRIAKLSEELF